MHWSFYYICFTFNHFISLLISYYLYLIEYIEFTCLQYIPDPTGWWTGKLRNKEGLFPSNYVESI